MRREYSHKKALLAGLAADGTGQVDNESHDVLAHEHTTLRSVLCHHRHLLTLCHITAVVSVSVTEDKVIQQQEFLYQRKLLYSSIFYCYNKA